MADSNLDRLIGAAANYLNAKSTTEYASLAVTGLAVTLMLMGIWYMAHEIASFSGL